MKKLYTLFVAMLVCLEFAQAQTPQGFKYQAVVRDNSGLALANKLVAIRLSLLLNTTNGTSVYSEVHNIATNDFGVANLNVGSGSSTIGNFANIDWGAGTYFLKTEADITNGTNFVFLGTSQLLSVPYAMYAAKSANAANDFDKDSLNEIQNITLNGNNLQLNKNGGSVDLTKYDKDSQQLVLNGNTLSITKGNTIVLSGAVDLDSDPTNEIQNLSIKKDTISISKANFIVLPKDNDADSTNEIQSLKLINDSLYLSKSNSIILPTANSIPSGSIVTFENYDTSLLSKGYSYLGRIPNVIEKKVSDSATWQWDASIPNNYISPVVFDHTAVWTGTEMIIWGGEEKYGALSNGGAKYNPKNGVWTSISSIGAPSSRASHSAVWTGTEMIIWGGYTANHVSLNDGAKFNTTTNMWTSISSIGAPSPRASHSAVWTGTEMIIWGGSDSIVYKYNPLSNTWTSISSINAPSSRSYHSAIWSGTEMIVWGGYTKQLSDSNKISIYNPTTNIWTNTIGINTPGVRYRHNAIWSGKDMIIIGGSLIQGGPSNEELTRTYQYNLTSNKWVEIPINTNTPTYSFGHSAIYDGNEMIIWGGNNDIGKTMKLISPTYSGSVSTYLHLYKKN